ncbi:N4-gp56 family major capsid protein [Fodinicurvata sediminis]|uniref:N4-gp56 family major capsid protein n=1 Tax=Fodinicurvata sediminis TaxID=1121832 RepID=UPI0003B5C0CD|nr:N4-gp56 family major capsid protein [Fodinicurvata sediminis]
MTMTRYSDAGVSPRTNVYAERQMLRHAAPVTVLDKFGLTKPMPKNKTQTIKFRRPKVFTAATTPLVEGVTPSATQFAYEDVTASLKQYGQVVEVTDVIEDTHEDPVLNDASEQAGENIGRTTEALTYGVLRAGTNVHYANGTGRGDVNTAISLSKVRAVTRALKAQKAMKITKILDGSVNYATRPVEASFVAVHHTDLEADIRELPGFIPVAEYGNRKPVSEYEIGTVEDVRFVASPDLEPFEGEGSGTLNGMVSQGGSNVDVYPILIFGKEAYGIVPLRGQGAVSPTILRPGKSDKSDPLGQRGYVGWKTWHTAVILNQVWMARLEVGATDL